MLGLTRHDDNVPVRNTKSLWNNDGQGCSGGALKLLPSKDSSSCPQSMQFVVLDYEILPRIPAVN